MEHLKKGDTISINLGNSSLPSLVVYNGPGLFGLFYPRDYKKDTEIVYKSKNGWSSVISCSKAMYGGDNRRMVLIEKTLGFLK